MASTESVIGGGGLAGRIQRLALAAVAPVGERHTPAADRELDIRAIASTGLAALVGLPLLLIASLALDAPFAAAAAIACGYLAIAAAQRAEKRRSATAISGVVLIALAAVSPIMMLQHESALSATTLAALLLAPFFAAAPALTRFALKRAKRVPAARLAQALPAESCGEGRRAEEALLPIDAPAPQCASGMDRSAGRAACLRSDAGEAVAFAERKLANAACEKNVTVTRDAGAGVAVACDRQTLRRIACLVAAHAIAVTPSGGSVRLTARRVRGAILLRVTCTCANDLSMADTDAGDLAIARALVEGAGGTLLVEQAREQLCVSVRLDLARPTMANENGESGVRRVAS